MGKNLYFLSKKTVFFEPESSILMRDSESNILKGGLCVKRKTPPMIIDSNDVRLAKMAVC
jgi:hypothetical protein